ncbi:MAG: PASTA domain-containing protein [Crocinitomicaceae bacterium]|nr:PASTA domain-containing protein [Crocinitomicaceae bacterium]
MDLLKKLGNFVWSMAFLINFGSLILLYIIMFFSLQGCLDGRTHHGEKISVPDMVGKNSNNAKSLLAGTNLNYVILDSIYDPSKVSGTILEQDPGATSSTKLYVKQGRTIKLRVSKRTMLVEMPGLVDKSQRFAEGVLRNREFRYSIDYKPSREAHGAVISQMHKGEKIAKGTRLPIGSRIKLIIGRNESGIPLELPNLYGLSIVEAKQRVDNMLNMEFFIGSCTGCLTSADSSIARIFTQSPEFEEGAIVASGSSITVVASKEFVDLEENQPPQ